jgi:hypothetical protein
MESIYLYHRQRKLLLHFRDLIWYFSFYLLSTINDAIILCQEANRKFGISLAHHESFRYGPGRAQAEVLDHLHRRFKIVADRTLDGGVGRFS